MARMIYQPSGNYEKSIEEAGKAIGIDPDFAVAYHILAGDYQYQDRLNEAERTLKRASDRKLQSVDLLSQGYDIAFLKGDRKEMERQVAISQGNPGAEQALAVHQALALAYSGHQKEARQLAQRVVDSLLISKQRELAALFQTGAALREGFFGNAKEAREKASAALALSKEMYVEYGAAFALALAGDSGRAQELAADLQKRFGEDTSVNFNHLPALRALIAVNLGKPSRAIELLQIASPSELGTPRCAIHGFFGALYPIYVRGEAYLAQNQGREAAAEYQKILDHRGVVVSDPIGALARWRLGKALAMSGDNAKALKAYEDFLALWKDADRSIPVLHQAKAEYAKLTTEGIVAAR
jgi:tetratricopeptide (TPR) repeat protein